MRKTYRILAITLILAACLLSMAARPRVAPSGPDVSGAPDKTLSPYFVVMSDDPEKDALPLKSTQAEVKIAGVVAGVKITQVYQNQGKKALEAIYVFPASTRAAVHAMRMTVGERVIVAEIMERKQARQTYEDAKKEGKTTSLLEQERPNVFQMNVANILPGDTVKVELNYLELLEPRDLVYEFVLPTVVGPRYSKMAAQGAPDTEKWVQNPYLHQGQAPPYTYGLSVTVHSALPIHQLVSPSHEVEVNYSGKTAAQVKVKDEKTAGNKDFVLRYSLAGGKIETGLLMYPGQDENFFLLMLEPPARVKAEAVAPREYIFIVDVSGSMHGFPLEISKALMKDIITGLKPQDFMNVMLFESGNAVLSESGSLPATAANKEKALNFIQAQPGGGGTEILPAIKRALALPRTPKTSRIVVVATDGYVHVEPETFQLIRQSLGEANLFPFGIGTAVNRHLIEGMARAGMGEPFVVFNPGEAPKEAARFRQYIESPVLTKIQVSYDGFQAYEVEPPALPDLFALRPLTMIGKYRGSPAGTIVVKGSTAQGPYEQKIKVADGQAGADNWALRPLWARHRIMRLADQNLLEENDGRIKEVTDLGLKYSLMTAYTSFVAVDKIKRADGQVVTVKQPLPLPEGVSDLAVGGSRPGRMAKYKAGGPRSGHYAAAMPDMAAPSPAERGEAGFSPKVEEAPPIAATPPAKVTVKVQVSQVTGNLNQAAVQQALEGKLAELESCCDQAVKDGSQLPKEITLTFTIGPDGKVTGEKLVQTPVTASWAKCLSDAVRSIIFPNPGKAAGVVTVKLILEGK